MNLWRDKDSGEVCHVNFADYDPELEFYPVLVMYFGDDGSAHEWFDAQDFLESHEPERMH